MGDRIFQILDFFLERPPLTGVLVAGALYVIKKTRKKQLTVEERQHLIDLYESQRTYAEKMYDPPTEEESAAGKPRR